MIDQVPDRIFRSEWRVILIISLLLLVLAEAGFQVAKRRHREATEGHKSPPSGGAFPFTIGRIEHAFHVRPDLVAIAKRFFDDPPASFVGCSYNPDLGSRLATTRQGLIGIRKQPLLDLQKSFGNQPAPKP
jgi:hypothetical protein